ncbi:hypothetical protein LCGC14_1706700 [marine sediment metagenome]|uniref:Uncharacterized protein n=1 Tax=marine sediment metagenome TaxID=412755 RepID=A0A0F9I401_9ZZZZ
MELTTTKCDACGKLETCEDYLPKGWFSLLKQAGDYDKDFWGKTRDICVECGKVMRLPLAIAKGNHIIDISKKV